MFRDFTISYVRDNVKIRAERKLPFQRQSVAWLLSRSARHIPHAAGNVEFDITPVIEYGHRIIHEMKSSGKKHTPEEITKMALHKNLSAFYMKTIAHTMYRIPLMNSYFEWAPLRNGGRFLEAEDIIPCFTVHTKRGVMAPIIRNPHLKDIFKISDEMRDLTRKARRTDMNMLYRQCAWEYLWSALKELDFSGMSMTLLWLKSTLWPEPIDDEVINTPPEDRLTPKDVCGSTCTVANIGMSVRGWQTVTVIPPPSTVMWGIGMSRIMPRYVDGVLKPRHILTVCVTFDHRALDGGHIFDFENVMNEYFQEPERIFLWKPGDPI